MTISIHAVQVGRIAPLGPDRVPSGFVKSSVQHQIDVTGVGLMGDEQADLTVHGGPEKAVYGYALQHYRTWLTEYPEHADVLIPGGFGENLTINGLVEDEVFVGDVHRMGTALLQVCQPRQPCFKLALRFGDKRLPKAMVKTGRAGWYYRVLEAGQLAVGDEVELVARPQPGFPLSRLIAIINRNEATSAETIALAAMPELASGLRHYAQDRLRTRE